jgi:hypothetical protein
MVNLGKLIKALNDKTSNSILDFSFMLMNRH